MKSGSSPSKTSSKRHLSNSSLSPQIEGKKTKQFVSPNKFAVLSQDTDEFVSLPPHPIIRDELLNSSTTNQARSQDKTHFFSPPFYVSSGYDYSTLTKDLLKLIQPSCIYFKSTSKYLVIRTDNASNYNLVMDYLLANDEILFHTYQSKSSKAYSVYIRHLHPSTSIQDIQTSLINEGHNVIRVINIINRFTKVNLPLFRADITIADNNSDILKLNSILHTKVKVELPRKKSSPPQCTHCQAYFHTTNYCRYHPRCVKCGENHSSSDCTKSPSVPAKCALCSGPHTSSYKGCPHYKKIISTYRKQTSSNRPTKLTVVPPVTPCNANSKPKRNLTYAKVTANVPSSDQSTDFITKFLEELKSILNPLLIALTTIINKVSLPVSSFP